MVKDIFVFLLACLLGSCSTDAICDDACDIWDEQGCWDYDICYTECKVELDWTRSYVKCLEKAETCSELEDCG